MNATPSGPPQAQLPVPDATARQRPVIACHECDLLQHASATPTGGSLRCCRCRAVLQRRHSNSLDRALACSLGACVLWIISNTFPIVGLAVNGDVVETTLFGAVRVLYRDGMWPLSVLVLTTTILMPAWQAFGTVWLLVPLHLGRRPWQADAVFRWLRVAGEWGMTEVLMLGLLVALVKLAHIASVVTGVALWSSSALMLLLVATAAAFDEQAFWGRLREVAAAKRESGISGNDNANSSANTTPIDALQQPLANVALHGATAAANGIYVCHTCGLCTPGASEAPHHCPRCGAHLHMRKPASLQRTWAFLIAATILYVPANLLPVMNTSSLFGAQKDTILSGVVYLWTSGSWPLAIIVFIASIAVPMLKILAIGYLAISTQLHWHRQPAERARIYRIVELVGRWSMLDIYVIAMLTALVQFSALATIQAGPAAIAFGAVVVLTMFAALSFDPRLIWDQGAAR
jgi:paraquat-inducible protein A